MNDDVKRHQKSDLIQMQSLPLNDKAAYQGLV